MRNLGQNHATVWKRRITQVIALLFVLYAFADVTVLQAYCGNEAVGIPPAHHFAKESKTLVQDKKENSVESDQSNFHQPQDGQNEVPAKNCDDDDCFCCCSHAIAGYFSMAPAPLANTRISSGVISFENKHPNSDVTHLFRPPRIA
jgi:hypothetical protein